jgi:hypothetical protein
MCLEHENVGFDCAMVQGVIQPCRLRRCAVQCLPVLEADLRETCAETCKALHAKGLGLSTTLRASNMRVPIRGSRGCHDVVDM